MRLCALLTSCLLACALWISPASAQDAREAFRKGENAYSVGNYELAITEWERAYALDPRPRIQFNLAQAFERLGRWSKAVAALKNFLENADPDDPTYGDANARMQSLKERLAKTGLVLEGGLDGGAIKVDDKEWGRTPRPDKIPLTPGEHQVVVSWGDRPDFQATASVPPGRVVKLTIHTPAATNAGGKTTLGTDSLSDAPKSKRPIILIASGGAGILAGGALLAMGLQATSQLSGCGDTKICRESELRKIAEDNNLTQAQIDDLLETNPVSPDSDVDAAETKQIVGLAAGGVLLLAGAGLTTWGIIDMKKGGNSDRATRCSLTFTGAMCRTQF